MHRQGLPGKTELEICKNAYKILRDAVVLSKNNHLKVRKFMIQFNLKETQASENLPMPDESTIETPTAVETFLRHISTFITAPRALQFKAGTVFKCF